MNELFTTNPITGQTFYHGFYRGGRTMVMARIIFKNKNGWSTCGPAFRKAETLEDLQKFAEKKAKGREFQIQLQSEEMTKRYADSAEAV